MRFETLRCERRGPVAVIELHRPERGNALNGAMSRELPRAWSWVKSDPDVRVALVTAAGERHFCTGFDVAEVASGSARVGEEAERGTLASLRFTALQNRCWKPVVTAVNGAVTGGGLHFVADSDLVIAAEQATFFDNHVRVGLVSGTEPIGLARRGALEPVLRMAFLGGAERMPAGRALELGWVSEVVPGAELRERALALAARIAENSPAALAASKRALWESLDVGLAEALAAGWRTVEAHRGHPDAAEGARAFAEGRPARFAPLALAEG